MVYPPPVANSRSARSASATRISAKGVSVTLLRAFDAGEFSLFFRHWPSIIAGYRDQTSVRHLEFYIRIYFATQHFRNVTAKARGDSQNKAMEHFKAYLESTSGSEMSKSVDFAPFFALPFVKNIDGHPLFKDLKEQQWVALLRENLVKFLNANIEPAIAKETTTSAEDDAVLVAKLKERLATAERKQSFYKSRCKQFQLNYHRLILVASELVDALEQAIQGVMITPEQIEDLRTRMFDTRDGNSATTSQFNSTEDEDRSKVEGSSITKTAPDDPGPNTTAANTTDAVAFAPELHTLKPDLRVGSVDWTKVKERLSACSVEKEIALLLQALRWSLTQCSSAGDRTVIATALFREDLLFLNHRQEKLMHSLINSSSNEVQESACRLVNAFCCLKSGRSYLLRCDTFLSTVIDAVKNNSLSINSRTHLLVALQKCSVRRKVQEATIRLNVLKWLIEFLLMENKTMPCYALEYGTALLMNLSLTTQGRLLASDDPQLVLNLLCDLMNHEHANLISHYVHGTLFSVLSRPNVRHKARKMGLYSILDNAMQRPKTPDDVKQIPYIIKQLNGELAENLQTPSDDEYSSMDETENGGRDKSDTGIVNQDQSVELFEPELDEGDTLTPDADCRKAGIELLKTFCKDCEEHLDKSPTELSEKGDNGSCGETVSELSSLRSRDPRVRPTAQKIGKSTSLVTRTQYGDKRLSSAATSRQGSAKAASSDEPKGATRTLRSATAHRRCSTDRSAMGPQSPKRQQTLEQGTRRRHSATDARNRQIRPNIGICDSRSDLTCSRAASAVVSAKLQKSTVSWQELQLLAVF